jgi:hypothetical protein
MVHIPPTFLSEWCEFPSKLRMAEEKILDSLHLDVVEIVCLA